MISAKDIKIAITWSQVGLTFLSWIHTILVSAWAISALLNGFSNGILHVPPIMLEILLIKFIAETTGFGINAINRAFVVETTRKHNMILLTGIALVVGIIVNVIHLVFTAIEMNKCDSLICENNFWFLVIFAVLLGCLAVLECVLIYFFIVYDRHLKNFNVFIQQQKQK